MVLPNQVDELVLFQLLHNLVPNIAQHEHDVTFFSSSWSCLIDSEPE